MSHEAQCRKMPVEGFRETRMYWCSSGHGGNPLLCAELVFLSFLFIAENNRKGHLPGPSAWITHPHESQGPGAPGCWNPQSPQASSISCGLNDHGATPRRLATITSPACTIVSSSEKRGDRPLCKNALRSMNAEVRVKPSSCLLLWLLPLLSSGREAGP